MKKIILVCVVLVLAGCDGEPVNVFDVGAEKERREMKEKWKRARIRVGNCEHEDIECKKRENARQFAEMENWGGLSEKPKTKED